MDMRKIKKLIELIQSTGVAEIEIREGEESVRITREAAKTTPMMVAAPSVMPIQAVSTSSEAQPHAKSPEAPSIPEKQTIKAPMVGTIYLSPTPGTKPFVEIG